MCTAADTRKPYRCTPGSLCAVNSLHRAGLSHRQEDMAAVWFWLVIFLAAVVGVFALIVHVHSGGAREFAAEMRGPQEEGAAKPKKDKKKKKKEEKADAGGGDDKPVAEA